VHDRCALTLLRLFYEQHKSELQGEPATMTRQRGRAGSCRQHAFAQAAQPLLLPPIAELMLLLHPPAGLPAPLHRLGRGTSGLLLCGCSAAARRQLSADFAEKDGGGGGGRRLRKVYRTLVAGLVQQEEASFFPVGLTL
jgi:hypothetical protein